MEKADRIWHREIDGTFTFKYSSDPQGDFIRSPASEILFSGMYGNGKSVGMCVKAWKLCEYYPGIRGVALRRHYEDLKISTLRLFPRLFGTRMWAEGVVGGKEPSCFNFRNGSSIDFFGMSGDAERTKKLLSTEYGFGMADEVNELSESEWELLLGRLRQGDVPIRQAFGSCNPDGPNHWLYSRFRVADGSNRQWRQNPCPRCARSGQSVVNADCSRCHGSGTVRQLVRELFMAGPNDNNANHPAEYVAWRNNLTGTRAARYRDGKWVAFEGQVFQSWDPNIHLCDPPAEWARWGNLPPPDWPRVVGIDLGFDHPFVAEWFAISPEGHWYRYREIYMSRRTIDEHAEHMLKLDAAELEILRQKAVEIDEATPEANAVRDYADYLAELNIVMRPCDHDRGEREMLAKAGVWTSRANKEISAGLQTIMNAMDPDPRGVVHLHLIRNARVELDPVLHGAGSPTSLEDEIPLARWDKRLGGVLGGVSKDLPVDKDNHAIDAMRYALHSYAGRVQVAVY